MFQSTHSRGVRLRVLVRAYSIQPFQSTHPRGVRPYEDAIDGVNLEFQSTHPRGVRHDTVFGYQNRYDVSIHAPAWGATQ